ncbi:hypothetical protein D3C87_1601470 [compost metagenome]
MVQMYGTVILEAKFHRPGPVSQVFIRVASVNATCPSRPSVVLPPMGVSRPPLIFPSR